MAESNLASEEVVNKNSDKIQEIVTKLVEQLSAKNGKHAIPGDRDEAIKLATFLHSNAVNSNSKKNYMISADAFNAIQKLLGNSETIVDGKLPEGVKVEKFEQIVDILKGKTDADPELKRKLQEIIGKDETDGKIYNHPTVICEMAPTTSLTCITDATGKYFHGFKLIFAIKTVEELFKDKPTNDFKFISLNLNLFNVWVLYIVLFRYFLEMETQTKDTIDIEKITYEMMAVYKKQRELAEGLKGAAKQNVIADIAKNPDVSKLISAVTEMVQDPEIVQRRQQFVTDYKRIHAELDEIIVNTSNAMLEEKAKGNADGK